MVRINLISPESLADQHLIAEYNETLMLLGYVRKHPAPANIPKNYTLGKGHMTFFKDKLLYLKKRHEKLKAEMTKRGFVPTITIDLSEFPQGLQNDWKPTNADAEIIKKRIIEKLRKKPGYYRYYGKHMSQKFLVSLIGRSTIQ